MMSETNTKRRQHLQQIVLDINRKKDKMRTISITLHQKKKMNSNWIKDLNMIPERLKC